MKPAPGDHESNFKLHDVIFTLYEKLILKGSFNGLKSMYVHCTYL